jgi:hypothetical protein
MNREVKSLYLEQKIPVYIGYFTSWVDREENTLLWWCLWPWCEVTGNAADGLILMILTINSLLCHCCQFRHSPRVRRKGISPSCLSSLCDLYLRDDKVSRKDENECVLSLLRQFGLSPRVRRRNIASQNGDKIQVMIKERIKSNFSSQL